jgi:hypothetical protein
MDTRPSLTPRITSRRYLQRTRLRHRRCVPEGGVSALASLSSVRLVCGDDLVGDMRWRGGRMRRSCGAETLLTDDLSNERGRLISSRHMQMHVGNKVGRQMLEKAVDGSFMRSHTSLRGSPPAHRVTPPPFFFLLLRVSSVVVRRSFRFRTDLVLTKNQLTDYPPGCRTLYPPPLAFFENFKFSIDSGIETS